MVRFEDLVWFIKFLRCFKINILFIIFVKYVKEIVVGVSYYRFEREIYLKKLVVRWSIINYK